MNIFVDATGVTPVATGLAKYSLKLLARLTAVSQHNFRILCSRALPDSHELFALAKPNVAFLHSNIPTIGPRRDVAYTGVRREVERCDIFHCLSSYLPMSGVRIPSIVTVHDLKYVRYPEFLSNPLKAWYLKRVLINTMRRSTCLIAVSASTKRDLIDLGADADRIIVIYEASAIDEATGEASVQPVTVPPGPYFLYVGEHRPHKNLGRLLSAYRQLRDSSPADLPRLVLAGQGTHDLQEDIDRLRLRGATITLGPVSDVELVQLYRHALAFVFPTLYEGFGLPVLEAMSLGVPVITSRFTSTEEIAGDAAELVDPSSVSEIYDALKTIANNGARRKELVQAGLTRAAQFSWIRAADQTLSIYQRLI